MDDFVPDVPFTLTVGDGEVNAVPKAPADG
jgi:hypothetical protein